MKNDQFTRNMITESCHLGEAARALQAIGSMLQRDSGEDSGWCMDPEDRAGLQAAVGPLGCFVQTVAWRVLDHLDDLEEEPAPVNQTLPDIGEELWGERDES